MYATRINPDHIKGKPEYNNLFAVFSDTDHLGPPVYTYIINKENSIIIYSKVVAKANHLTSFSKKRSITLYTATPMYAILRAILTFLILI